MIGSCSSGRPCSPGAAAQRCAAGQRALHGGDQIADVERLGQVLEGAALGRPHRREQRVLRAHHDHRQVGPQRADARQQVERVLVGQSHVGDHDVAVAGGDPAPERGRDAGRLHVVALARQGPADHRADGGVVLGEQDLLAAHATSRCGIGSCCCLRGGQADPEGGARARPAGRRRRRDGRPRSWRPATGRGRCRCAWC